MDMIISIIGTDATAFPQIKPFLHIERYTISHTQVIMLTMFANLANPHLASVKGYTVLFF